MGANVRLLAGGASALALIAAAPALAAGGYQETQSGPTADVLYTIDVTDVFDWGQSVSGTGSQSATVNSPGYGTILLSGTATTGNASVVLDDLGTLNILAQATGTSAAQAALSDGVVQTANAAQQANVALTNAGTLTLHSHAKTSGYGSASPSNLEGIVQLAQASQLVELAAVGSADAHATLRGGIVQSAQAGAVPQQTRNAQLFAAAVQTAPIASTGATVSLTNNAGQTIDISASAQASGGYGAASATVTSAINQSANATGEFAASATLTNLGTLTVGATATGVDAAHANVTRAIVQNAVADSASAGDLLTNAGTLTISATANREGGSAAYGSSGYGSGGYGASATVNTAIHQSASAAGGVAGVALDNTGALTISATAQAASDSGGFFGYGGSALADARVDGAVAQDVSGANGATASLTNSLTFLVSADAKATATASSGYGNARASATVESGIAQVVNAATGGASALLDNSGSLTLSATATVNARNAGTANASNAYGILQAVGQTTSGDGPGVGPASATLTNSGALAITATADVNSASGSARANAAQVAGIVQQVRASGDATATLTNTGTIALGATANANGGNFARAFATAAYGILQNATAFDGGNAAVSLTNDAGAKFGISAKATATATNFASASASNYEGIRQLARASGDGSATATLVNSGTIGIDVSAIANGGSEGNGTAEASASLTSAFSQVAESNGGVATAQFTNSGSFALTATSKAVGGNYAEATATADSAFYQDASGQTATANLANNTGASLTISAAAQATGGYAASAFATVDTAIEQDADGRTATVSLTNDGTLSVTASAIAKNAATSSESGNARAFASLSSSAIGQFASASSNAGVTLANSGTITLTATANATSNRAATATASVSTGINQNADVFLGNASASLTNSGQLTIGATANAVGTGAFALANIDEGITQGAQAGYGLIGTPTSASVVAENNASVTLTNTASGVMSIAAAANATATDGNANAIANVRNAVSQSASALTGAASASLVNDGRIDISANANAITTRGVAAATANLGYGSSGGYGSSFAGFGAAGIRQGLDARTATADLANTGTLDLIANAQANGRGLGQLTSESGAGARAVALVGGGIAQGVRIASFSSGSTPGGSTPTGSASVLAAAVGTAKSATATLTNSGAITIAAQANAVAQGSAATAEGGGGFGGASANATVGAGISQGAELGAERFQGARAAATATSSVASLTLTNQASGTIAIGATATATADLDANANALVSAGINQAIVDGAFLSGVFGGSFDGNASGSATFANSGTIDIDALAEAVSVGGDATAVAGIGGIVPIGFTFIPAGAVNQVALVANADLTVTNDGLMNILASASAVAGTGAVNGTTSSGGTFVTGRIADAVATVNAGVEQIAIGNGSQSIDLANTGTLNVVAGANAVATQAAATSGSAEAQANVGTGVVQEAITVGQQIAASIALTNSGTLAIGAGATAVADGFARASASVGYGIIQGAAGLTGDAVVDSTGVLTVDLTNSGTAQIAALAKATGQEASASAEIFAGIEQQGTPADGIAALTLTNSGSVTIMAAADAAAVSSADAGAGIGTGVQQVARTAGADGVTASLNNSGTMLIDADATANGPGAFAGAGIGAGLTQTVSNASRQVPVAGSTSSGATTSSVVLAQAGNASATLDNSGTLTVQAVAAANGVDFGSANATIGTGIVQRVSANGGGTATATLTNSGTLTLLSSANGVGASASAVASIDDGIDQIVSASPARSGSGSTIAAGGDAVATLTNSSSGVLNIAASAKGAGTDFAAATAAIGNGISQSASATGGGAGSVNLDNAGKIAIGAIAAADAAAGPAFASASVSSGIFQRAEGSGEVSATLTSSGTLSLTAMATATGTGAGARANLRNGINQIALGGLDATQPGTATGSGSATTPIVTAGTGNATVSLTNSGSPLSINAIAVANASGNVAPAFASAEIGTGINQFASAPNGVARADLTNSGTINIGASAKLVSAATQASGFAGIRSGIYQNAVGTEATVALTNSGTINIGATANVQGGNLALPVAVPTGTGTGTGTATGTATGSGTALQDGVRAVADIGQGIVQIAKNNASLTNSGTISIAANAKAAGGDFASASASIGTGLRQISTEPSVTFTNSTSGVFSVSAVADADAADTALGFAGVVGVHQIASGEGADATLTNDGTFLVTANAVSGGAGAGAASATAIGALEDVSGGSGSVTFGNSKTYTVQAAAAANNGGGGTAEADALGYAARVDTASLTATNSGALSVSAQATAADALANAGGAIIAGATNAADSVSGTLSNSGSIAVAATAKGAAGEANALGIALIANSTSLTLSNSGAINVSAITQGGTQRAVGILIGTDTGTIPGDPLAVDEPVPGGIQLLAAPLAAAAVTPLALVAPAFTINNDGGTIVARVSGDGGATFQRGTAIDTSGEPNNGAINLNGNGFIYGDIITTNDDVTTVAGGKTTLDGVVNPSGALLGDLTIANGGTLLLVNQPINNPSYDGPAGANVNNFTVSPGGAIEFQIPLNSAGTPLNGQYPQVFANTATITGGTLIADLSLLDTLIPDSIVVQDIINANVLNGQFATVITNLSSPLISVAAVYDNTADVDLIIQRTPFNAVPGLTRNQFSVARGIENVYDPATAGPFRSVLTSLFSLNAGQYFSALDQLGGAPYAGYLQSLTGLSSRYNTMLASQTECPLIEVTTELPCRQEGGVRLWGSMNYGRANKDGDANAGGYFGSQVYGTFGGDVQLGSSALLGASIGYVDNNLNFSRYNSTIKTDGVAFGGYAVYDPGNFYVKGIASYMALKGNSRRRIQFGTLDGFTGGEVRGRALALTGEVGFRLPIGGSTLTPFAAIEYEATKLRGLTESGVAGADLDVDGGRQRRAATDAGLSWAGSFGGLVPQVKVAWRHQFNSRDALVGASFADAPGSDFSVISPVEKRDQAVVDMKIEGPVGGGIYAKAGYQGRLAKDGTVHSGTISLIYRFGGK